MSLKEELKLKKGFDIVEHEALLNIYYTASLLKKRADAFFKSFSLTDVQFNVMMLLIIRRSRRRPEPGTVKRYDARQPRQYHNTYRQDGKSGACYPDKRFSRPANKYNQADRQREKTFCKGRALLRPADKKNDVRRYQPEQKKLIAVLEKIRANIKA